MRLVLVEYLRMLRESGEFEILLPDLLLAMNIVPISKSQKGARQAGVDLAAVGPDDSSVKTLWLSYSSEAISVVGTGTLRSKLLGNGWTRSRTCTCAAMWPRNTKASQFGSLLQRRVISSRTSRNSAQATPPQTLSRAYLRFLEWRLHRHEDGEAPARRICASGGCPVWNCAERSLSWESRTTSLGTSTRCIVLLCHSGDGFNRAAFCFR